jgi:hypothetical protein
MTPETFLLDANGQRGSIEVNALAGEDLGLSVQPQMTHCPAVDYTAFIARGEFADQQVRGQVASRSKQVAV